MPVYQYFWCRTLKTVQSLHQMEVNSLVHHWNIAGKYLIKTLLCFKTLQGRNILVNLGFELIFKTWKILMGKKKILLENTLVVVLGCFLHDYFLRCKRAGRCSNYRICMVLWLELHAVIVEEYGIKESIMSDWLCHWDDILIRFSHKVSLGVHRSDCVQLFHKSVWHKQSLS